MGQRIIPVKKFFVTLENDLSFLLSLAWLLGAGNLTGAKVGHSRRIQAFPSSLPVCKIARGACLIERWRAVSFA